MPIIVFNIEGNINGVAAVNQAIKVFAEKNKKTTLYVVGDQKNLTVFAKGKNNIIPVSAFDEGQARPKQEDYVSAKAWDCFQSVKADLYISFDKKNQLKSEADNHLVSKGFPAYVTRFLSSTPNRFSLLADCGCHPSLVKEDFAVLAEEVSAFDNSVFSIGNPTLSLLSPTNNLSDLSDELRDGYDILESHKRFQGLTSADHLIEGKTDIVLSNATLAVSAIQTTQAIYGVFEKKYLTYKKEDYRAKIAFYFGKKMIQEINSLTSAKMDQSGYFLLGYSKMVLKANETTNFGGVLGMLDNAQKYLHSLILESHEPSNDSH